LVLFIYFQVYFYFVHFSRVPSLKPKREHLFFQCNLINAFWNDAFSCIQPKIPVRLTLSWEILKFGLLIKDNRVFYVINNLLLLLKCCIHKRTFFKISPRLLFFKEEFLIYLEILRRDETSQSNVFVLFMGRLWFYNKK